MHLAHIVPFTVTKQVVLLRLGIILTPYTETRWLQDVFDVTLVIMVTTTKNTFPANKSTRGMRFVHLQIEMLGTSSPMASIFKKTSLFCDFDFMEGSFYLKVVKISRCITYNTSKAVFGFTERSETAFSDNSQQWATVGHRRVPLHGGTNSSSTRINLSAHLWDWSQENLVDSFSDFMRNRPRSIFSSRAT